MNALYRFLRFWNHGKAVRRAVRTGSPRPIAARAARVTAGRAFGRHVLRKIR